MPKSTPDDTRAKSEAYTKLTSGSKWFRLKQLADIQIAQFFIPKTTENKERLTTDSTFRTYLNQGTQILDRGESMAISQAKRFFHWFLEFPEVVSSGGFDCILGNPPYLGDKKLKNAFGEAFVHHCRSHYVGAGVNDLVVYFYRRIFELISPDGFASLISTDSISEGDLRTRALSFIIEKGGKLNFAIKSLVWPGEANTNVALTTFVRDSNRIHASFIGVKEVSEINSFLVEGEKENEPLPLVSNSGLMNMGYYFLGDGFLLSTEEAKAMLNDNKNEQVIFPCFKGDDLNSMADLKPRRFIINFFDWSLEKAEEYVKPLERVRKLVKPTRDNTSRKRNRENWWLYAENRPGLRDSNRDLNRMYCTAQTTKYLNFREVSVDSAITQTAFVVATDNVELIGVLQSSLHYYWTQKYGNTLGSTFSYSPSKVFANFPFPSAYAPGITDTCVNLFRLRDKLMLERGVGLTELYNDYHNPDTNTPEILKLRECHIKLDAEALKSYGWDDVALGHQFVTLEYLPENDNIRFTISTDSRREILHRLLALNRKLFEQEEMTGQIAKKKECDEPMSKKPKASAVEVKPGSQELFIEPNLFNQLNTDEHVKIGSKVKLEPIGKESNWFSIGVQIDSAQKLGEESALAKRLLGKKAGDFIDIGNGFKVLEVRNG